MKLVFLVLLASIFVALVVYFGVNLGWQGLSLKRAFFVLLGSAYVAFVVSFSVFLLLLGEWGDLFGFIVLVLGSLVAIGKTIEYLDQRKKQEKEDQTDHTT